MTIPTPDHVLAWHVELPLLESFASAQTAVDTRSVVLIKLQLGDIAGWGEAAPVPGHTHQSIDEVWDSLQQSAASHGTGAPAHGEGMIGAAFAQAYADVTARLAGEPLWQRLGGSAPVLASAAIGLDAQGQPDRTQLETAAAAGYRHAKLKVSRTTEIDQLAILISDFPGLSFGVDANGSLDLDDTAGLRRIDDLGLLYIEQPGPAYDLAGHRQLRSRMTTPVSLDESASSETAIQRILADEAADIVNVKAGRFGTVETLRLAERIAAAGCGVRLGGLIESGVGRGHSIALATNTVFSTVGDIAASDRYFSDDLVRPQWTINEGQLVVSDRPGLGVSVDEATVAQLAVRSLSIPRLPLEP